MRLMRAVVTLAAVALLAGVPSAASTPAWLSSLRKAHLRNGFVLRGFPSGSVLKYGPGGSLIAAGPPLPWTESAFRAEWIRLHSDGLEIAGQRCVLVFDDRNLTWRAICLPGVVRLEVPLPTQPFGPLRAERLWSRIFMSASDVARAAPPYWHAFLTGGVRLRHLPGGRLDARLVTDSPSPAKAPRTAASNIAPPRVIKDPNPQYTHEAREARLHGSVWIRITVGVDGAAHDLTIIKPLGAGLDQAAIEAVTKWRFRPAQKNGRPVAATSRVIVNFEFH